MPALDSSFPAVAAVDENVDLPEQMKDLAAGLEDDIRRAVSAIEQINLQVRLLSFNAQIEAARAGEAGRSFGVVSEEMVRLSDHIKSVVGEMLTQTQSRSQGLARLSETLATDVVGRRLTDLAAQGMDVIDRNLYERSCDVRWWATDKAIVDVLQDTSSSQAARYATERLATILKAYTVYFDIVVADLEGRIVVNGSPAEYPSVGTCHAGAEWFRSAMGTPSGDHFGFQSVHASVLVGGANVLVYSCKVCEGGDASGRPLGVLGVVFRWDALARVIVEGLAAGLPAHASPQVGIVDAEGTVLAATSGLRTGTTVPMDTRWWHQGKAYRLDALGGRTGLIAHAPSVGYETYKTGWSFVVFHATG